MRGELEEHNNEILGRTEEDARMVADIVGGASESLAGMQAQLTRLKSRLELHGPKRTLRDKEQYLSRRLPPYLSYTETASSTRRIGDANC